MANEADATSDTSAEGEPGVHRLRDIAVEEVSLVDRAANKRRFLVVKRSGDRADDGKPKGRRDADEDPTGETARRGKMSKPRSGAEVDKARPRAMRAGSEDEEDETERPAVRRRPEARATRTRTTRPRWRPAGPTDLWPAGDKLGTGHVVARWTPGPDEPLGLHELRWFVQAAPGGAEQIVTVELDVLAAGAGAHRSGYALVSDLRAEGVTEADATDARLARLLRLASQYVDRMTGRFFDPNDQQRAARRQPFQSTRA